MDATLPEPRATGSGFRAAEPEHESGAQRRLRLLRGPLRLECVGAAAAEERRPFTAAGRTQISWEFDVGKEVGRGAVGVVYQARRKRDGQVVALKVMRNTFSAEHRAILRREHNILRSIEHPYIVRTLDFFESDAGMVLVLDFFPGLTLEDTVSCAPGGCLAEETAKRLLKMLLLAIDYLHQHRIVHRDVKPANVLVSNDAANLKLIDFNTARRLTEGGALTMTGTHQFMPPESLRGEPPSESGDIWALGLCLYFMLSGRLPQRQGHFVSVDALADAVAKRPVSFKSRRWRDTSEPCKDFMRRCLEIEKALRPAPMILIEHAWLKDGTVAAVAHAPLERSMSLPSIYHGDRGASWEWGRSATPRRGHYRTAKSMQLVGDGQSPMLTSGFRVDSRLRAWRSLLETPA